MIKDPALINNCVTCEFTSVTASTRYRISPAIGRRGRMCQYSQTNMQTSQRQITNSVRFWILRAARNMYCYVPPACTLHCNKCTIFSICINNYLNKSQSYFLFYRIYKYVKKDLYFFVASTTYD